MFQDYISLPLMLQMWLLVNLSFSIFDLSKNFLQKVVSVKCGNAFAGKQQKQKLAFCRSLLINM